MTDEKFDGIQENQDNPPPPMYFNILYYGLIIWGVIFCAYFIMGDWSSQNEFQKKMTSFRAQHNLQAPAEIKQQ